jgi:protein-S-isoprenylcysteine O-methyltransferase Ste14
MQEPSSVNSPASRIETDRSGVRIPPPLIYIAGFLVGVALEVAFPIAALPLALALAAALVGIVIWLALDGAAMLHFQRARTSMVPMRPSTALVTSGPYRFTRNPMYLGMAVLYAALALALGVIWALAVLPLVILALDRLVIAREEPYLERKFGDQYRQYRGRVRRWL